jgi:hypothetical protein
MTLADLRRAAELLPPGSAVTVPREALLAALTETAPASNGTGHADHDRTADVEQWLTADEVAERLHVSPRWAYDHGEQLGARHLSRRCVRFSSRAVDRYKARRT